MFVCMYVCMYVYIIILYKLYHNLITEMNWTQQIAVIAYAASTSKSDQLITNFIYMLHVVINLLN